MVAAGRRVASAPASSRPAIKLAQNTLAHPPAIAGLIPRASVKRL
jgi:hypothetical protein